VQIRAVGPALGTDLLLKHF